MRAIIRIKFNENVSEDPRQAMDDFLRLEGFSVVDLDADKKWLSNPRQKLMHDRVTSFVDSMAKPEERGLVLQSYIFSSYGTEGIVASRQDSELILIIYKHNLQKLQKVCTVLVESVIEYFNLFERKNTFSVIKYIENITVGAVDIREDSRQTNLVTGAIITSRHGKRRRIHKEKRLEYNLGRLLIFLTLMALFLSLYANFTYDFKIEELNTPIEYWVKFAERITGPLMVTSSVLWFNLWSHRLKMMSNKIVIEWR